MKYPLALHSKLEEVHSIVSKWKIEIDFNHVMKWILQFDPADYNLALSVIKNLNVIGADDLNGALSIAYSKLMRKAVERDAKISSKNTLFAGLGNVGKSGAMLSYHFRLINGISEENFLDSDTERFIEQGKIENIVLVDDVVATGNQASKEINDLSERVTPLGVKNIFLLTVCGFRDGIELVEEKTKAHTFSAFEYGPEDTATSFDSPFYYGINHLEREYIKQRLEYYGRVCSRAPFGYGGLGAFIVFSYNTPNCTLPLIWSDQNEWIPLFRRVRRINGIASFYKQFDRLIDTKKKANARPNSTPTTPTKPEHLDLTLFVEGKSDELVFDQLIDKFGIAKSLGVRSVSTLSFGGAESLIRMAPLLASHGEPAIVILEEDARNWNDLEKRLANIPYVFLKPNLFGLVNLEHLYEDEELADALPPLPPEPIAPTKEAYFAIERELYRHAPVSKIHARLRRIVDLHIDPVALERFVEELRIALSGLLERAKGKSTQTNQLKKKP